MTAEHKWKVGYCEYLYEDRTQPDGRVEVTTLHYSCWVEDDADPSVTSPRIIGTVNSAEENRTYPLAALKSVPEHVMVKWVKDALGADEVAEIEANAMTQYQTAVLPKGGGFPPEENPDPLPPLDEIPVT